MCVSAGAGQRNRGIDEARRGGACGDGESERWEHALVIRVHFQAVALAQAQPQSQPEPPTRARTHSSSASPSPSERRVLPFSERNGAHRDSDAAGGGRRWQCDRRWRGSRARGDSDGGEVEVLCAQLLAAALTAAEARRRAQTAAHSKGVRAHAVAREIDGAIDVLSLRRGRVRGHGEHCQCPNSRRDREEK